MTKEPMAPRLTKSEAESEVNVLRDLINALRDGNLTLKQRLAITSFLISMFGIGIAALLK